MRERKHLQQLYFSQKKDFLTKVISNFSCYLVPNFWHTLSRWWGTDTWPQVSTGEFSSCKKSHVLCKETVIPACKPAKFLTEWKMSFQCRQMSSDLRRSNITFPWWRQQSRKSEIGCWLQSQEWTQNNSTDVLSIQLVFGPWSPEIQPDKRLSQLSFWKSQSQASLSEPMLTKSWDQKGPPVVW